MRVAVTALLVHVSGDNIIATIHHRYVVRSLLLSHWPMHAYIERCLCFDTVLCTNFIFSLSSSNRHEYIGKQRS